ncbi:HNH endonuclease [Candidatus Micrarchaeota archaeon CG10_big_fil_rev_8_21_14_0_10_45_29]|nr:MAG: HNH endonuclease [Candidatus Micrarchaeota archaeon CG10_big_fil_rev_8_21_14_0_10_45_29]
MPLSVVKTIRDLIFWQYAKMISESSGFGKNNYGFMMDRYKKLKNEEISWSSSIREYLKEKECPNACAYCGSKKKLTLEHILLRSRGGPDISENAVMVCKSCNSSKGSKRLYEWLGLVGRDSGHRIAGGKYLKLIYSLHEKNKTLGKGPLCNKCDMEEKCPVKGELSVYCLEGCFGNG